MKTQKFFSVLAAALLMACGLEDIDSEEEGGGQQDGGTPAPDDKGGGQQSIKVTAPEGEIVLQVRVGTELSPTAGPYWTAKFDAPANTREFTFTYNRPAGSGTVYYIADYRHLPSGRYGWLCEGYTDSGQTAAALRGTLSVKEGSTAWPVGTWHRTNAVHTDGCVARATHP